VSNKTQLILKFPWNVHCINLHLRFNWYLNLIEVCTTQSSCLGINSRLGKYWSFMKRQLNQWWSTFPQILAKWTITFHQESLNIKKTMRYDVENLCPGLRQGQKCGEVKPVNGISWKSLLLDFPSIQSLPLV
jgi:hypothetical protein